MFVGEAVFRLKSALLSLTLGNRDEKTRNEICLASKYLDDNSPHLGIDIDGTITENPDFFRILSNSWPGEVTILTFRNNVEETIEFLRELSIYYDELHFCKSMDKSGDIKSLGIDVYIDDQDECIYKIPDQVTVLKIRNGGNFKSGKWLYSEDTGKLVV
jgi:uncharacterized HAD superfamily protein